MKKDVVLVCTRIADLPKAFVPALPRVCDGCGWRVWVSLSSPKVARVLCVQCAREEVPADAKLVVTKRQTRDISRVIKGWTQ